MTPSETMAVPVDAHPTARRWGVVAIGAVLLALGLLRAYPDGLLLARYVGNNLREVIYTPLRVRWIDFPGVLWAVWPILLGLTMVLTGSRRLLKAAAVTAIAMGIERSLSLFIAGVFDSGVLLISGQTPGALREGVLPKGIMLALAIGSAAGWLFVGVQAYRAFLSWRHELARPATTSTRPARRPAARLATCASWLIAMGLLGSLGWTNYLEVLDRVPWIRGLVLKGDPTPPAFFRRPMRPEDQRFSQANSYFDEGQKLQYQGNYAEARKAYAKALNRYEAIVSEFPNRTGYRRQYALSANNLSWFLVTCPDLSLREPEVAVELGKRAVALDPNDGNACNTLGVAYFRAGNFEAATKAFEKSMGLRGGGDSFDWFFLAMIDAVRGDEDKGRRIYEKATVWMADNRPRDAELVIFQIEAAEYLGLPKPLPNPPKPKARDDGRAPRTIFTNRPFRASSLGRAEP